MQALFLPLDPLVRDVTDLLKEECMEVGQAASKITRFGTHSYNPYAVHEGSNMDQLETELGDVAGLMAILSVLPGFGLNLGRVDEKALEKVAKLRRLYPALSQALNQLDKQPEDVIRERIA